MMLVAYVPVWFTLVCPRGLESGVTFDAAIEIMFNKLNSKYCKHLILTVTIMSGNTFGKLFSVTTFGESHGAALGCIIDGCPPGLELCEADLQHDLDRRRPGKNKFETQRREPDQVKILSGVFEGKTTGTPIGLMIENMDQRSKDYGNIKDQFRPAHADYTYMQKYGVRDYRGGGRSSARETAMRVAAGAVAKKYLLRQHGILVRGCLSQLGPIKVDQNIDSWDWHQVEENPFSPPTSPRLAKWKPICWHCAKKVILSALKSPSSSPA